MVDLSEKLPKVVQDDLAASARTKELLEKMKQADKQRSMERLRMLQAAVRKDS